MTGRSRKSAAANETRRAATTVETPRRNRAPAPCPVPGQGIPSPNKSRLRSHKFLGQTPARGLISAKGTTDALQTLLVIGAHRRSLGADRQHAAHVAARRREIISRR